MRSRSSEKPPGDHARQPGAAPRRLRCGCAADRAHDVEGASQPSPLGGHVPRHTDAGAARPPDSADLSPGSDRQRVATGRQRNGQSGCESRESGRCGSRIHTIEPAAPIVEFVPSPMIVVASHVSNLLEATTRGFEIAGRWTPVAEWRLDASYTAIHVTPNPGTASQDPSADGSAPRAQWQCGRRSRRTLTRRSTSRYSTSVSSSNSRSTPTRGPTPARNGVSPTVCPSWR